MLRARQVQFSVLSGIGAGAGAALCMMLVMLLLRWPLGLPTLPELMLNRLILLMGGRGFSDALDRLYYAGRPLLFTLILEGILLAGVLFGLLYTVLARPNPRTGRRLPLFDSALGGLLYGFAVGLLLNSVFLPLMGHTPFAEQPSGIYSASLVPLWAGMGVLGLAFGLALWGLVPVVGVGGRGSGVGDEVSTEGDADSGVVAGRVVDRRQALRIAGGTLLALVGGGIFWGVGTLLNQGGLKSPADRPAGGEASDASAVSGSGDLPPGPVDTPAPPGATPTPEATATPRPSPTGTPRPSTSTPTGTPAAQSGAPASTPAPSQPTSTATSTAAPTHTATPTATATPTGTATPTPRPVAGAEPPPGPVSIPLQEITPTAGFYHVSKNFFDPQMSSDGWKLSIKGLVDSPYELTYDQLTSLPSEMVTTGMMCISNPIGGGLIGNTTWRGVHLADLLKQAKPRKGVIDLLMTAADGYTDSIPYQKALDPDVMLVWEMGGAPLTTEHGYPARLLVPGIYGMKHVKWLTSIELVSYDYKGFWQQPNEGWSDPAPVNTMSRIDYPAQGTLKPGKQVIGGIAFAGDRSISKVEVSTDGGKTWHRAYLKPPASGTSWALWGYEWTPPGPGRYTVMVRATDGQGRLQSAKRTDPYPNGATGYHTVRYQVAG